MKSGTGFSMAAMIMTTKTMNITEPSMAKVSLNRVLISSMPFLRPSFFDQPICPRLIQEMAMYHVAYSVDRTGVKILPEKRIGL